MNNFYLKNRHLFEEDDDVPYIHQAEKLYQLIPRLKYDQNIQRNVFREREKELFVDQPKNIFSQNARNLLANNYNDQLPQRQEREAYLPPKQRFPMQGEGLFQQKDSYNSAPRGSNNIGQRESYNTNRPDMRPSYNQSRLEEPKSYFNIPEVRQERNLYQPQNPSTQLNPINFLGNPSRNSAEPKLRNRENNPIGYSFEPPVRDNGRENSFQELPKHSNNTPMKIMKKADAPFATETDQPQVQVRQRNERQSNRPERNEDFLKHDLENETPNYFAQLNRSPKKIVEAITESRKHNIFPHDAYVMLKRRMFNIRGDLNSFDDAAFPREKIVLISHLQGRAEQLESMGNKKTAQESLEKRVIASLNTERKDKLKALLRQEKNF